MCEEPNCLINAVVKLKRGLHSLALMVHHRNHKLVQHSIGNASSILSFYSVLDGKQLIEIITTTNNDKY